MPGLPQGHQQARRTFNPKVKPIHLWQMSREKAALVSFGFIPRSVRERNDPTPVPLTRLLVDTEVGGREKALSDVRKLIRSADSKLANHAKMTQLWKALFYSFWMCDGIVKQHMMAKRLGNFIKECHDRDVSVQYMRCFWECMEREWNGIDSHRLDKFLSLIRYFVHSAFDFMAANHWHYPTVCAWTTILRHQVDLLNSKNNGIFLHLCDVYVEELINVCRVDADEWHKKRFRPAVTFDALYSLLAPFTSIYLDSIDMNRRRLIIRKVFAPLMESMDFDAKEKEKALRRPGLSGLDLYKGKFLRTQRGRNRRMNMLREQQRIRFQIRQQKLKELVTKKRMGLAVDDAENEGVSEKALNEFLMEDKALQQRVSDWVTEKGNERRHGGDFIDAEMGYEESQRFGTGGQMLLSMQNGSSKIASEKVVAILKGKKKRTLDCVGKPNGRELKTWTYASGVSLMSMRAQRIDPLNPTRMRRRRKPLMFDKKNFSVILPFREPLVGGKKRQKELIEQYGEEMERRRFDPMLMEDKVRKFVAVFYQLSQDPKTPRKAKKHIKVLANIFRFHNQNEFGYDRTAIRMALQHADRRQQYREMAKKKRTRKIWNARKQRQMQKWNKLRQFGMKDANNTSRRLVARSANFITKVM